MPSAHDRRPSAGRRRQPRPQHDDACAPGLYPPGRVIARRRRGGGLAAGYRAQLSRSATPRKGAGGNRRRRRRPQHVPEQTELGGEQESTGQSMHGQFTGTGDRSSSMEQLWEDCYIISVIMARRASASWLVYLYFD